MDGHRGSHHNGAARWWLDSFRQTAASPSRDSISDAHNVTSHYGPYGDGFEDSCFQW